MKVLIISNSFWSLYNFRLDLIKFFKNKNIKIVAVASNDNYINQLKKICEKVYVINSLDRSTNPFCFINSLIRFFFICKKEKPDINITYTLKPNLFGGFVYKILKIKNISMITGMGYVFSENNFFKNIILVLYKICLHKSYCIFFQNPHDKKYFKKKKILSKFSSILPGSGIDLKKFNYRKYPISKKIKFLMISRNVKEKGVLDFIKAIQIVKIIKKQQVEFFFSGFVNKRGKNFISEERFKNWKKLGHIKSYHYKSNIKKIISNVHCVILPSYREGTPRSILESFALGRPAILSKVIGNDHLIKHGYNGYFCKVKNHNDLARKILTFCNLPNYSKLKMSYNSRKISMEFCQTQVFDKYWKILNIK